MIIIFLVTFLFYGYVRTQDADCNFVVNVTPGSSYFIGHPEFPRNYTQGRICRTIGLCQTGYNCRIDCTLQMPPPPSPTSCGTRDRVLVSRSGDEQLNAAESYCGATSVTLTSFQNKIVVGLIVPTDSRGGRFRCILSSSVATSNSNCRCGEKRASRIVGGVPTGVNEYPMMAALFDSGNQICGGTIVTTSYALTAAHCLYVRNVLRATSSLALGVGNYNLNNVTPYAVCSLVVNPNYNPQTFDYDAALIKTCTRFQFNLNVGPVCMPFRYLNNDLVGQTVTVLGWGTVDSGAPPSNVLRKVDVKVVPLSRCAAEYPDRDINQRRLCTFAAGNDSCQMDSGGPLLLTNPNTGLLFHGGLVSFGEFCAEFKASVGQRTTSILNWIVNVCGPDEVCVKDVN